MSGTFTYRVYSIFTSLHLDEKFLIKYIMRGFPLKLIWMLLFHWLHLFEWFIFSYSDSIQQK